jgi:hypothetical protein
VTGNTATLVSNYRVTPSGGASIDVVQAVLAASGRGVTLTLASPLSGGTAYTVDVSGITDLSGNPMKPGASTTFTATVAARPVAASMPASHARARRRAPGRSRELRGRPECPTARSSCGCST